MKPWHAWPDRAVAELLRYGTLYGKGFGDRGRLARLSERVATTRAWSPLEMPTVMWDGDRAALGIRWQTGAFRSPLADDLPPSSAWARIELLTPLSTKEPPVVLLLAATSEEGFARRRFFAAPLLRKGVGALFLENPYYGARRPPEQKGPFLRTVADQFAMNLATTLEARALLAWLRAKVSPMVAVSGFSQGAMMAAFAAVSVPFDVATIPCAAALDARSVFLEGALGHAFAWEVLAREEGSLDAARATFAAALQPVTLAALPPPRRTDLAILLGAEHDRFVPRHEVEALHSHWAGSELRWLDAGHVTAAAFHQREHRQAILDALSRY